MPDEQTERSPADVLAEFFPESAEAVSIMFDAIRIAGRTVDEGDDDGRNAAISEMLEETTPEIRTRVVVIADVFAELARAVRVLAMQVKADAGDPDISEGHAEVTADGFLVVSMGEKEIARIPFNPRRRDGQESKLASDILAEYTRLHALGGLEAAAITKGPVTGRRTAVSVMADTPPDGPAE